MHDSQALLIRTGVLTAVALVAFAANSLLCRAALGQGLADPASFTVVRILSGAILLLALLWWQGTPLVKKTNWSMASMLFIYMLGFSYAYQFLGAATGALLLFGFVQLTMFAAVIWRRERFARLALVGVLVAIMGLVYLLLPGIEAPNASGAALMAMAGIAWGIYSLLGQANDRPLAVSAISFAACVPLALILLVAQWNALHFTPQGFWLAVASGAFASGLGYVAWYAALPLLASGVAATVQLSVPLLAAIGGIWILDEPIDGRLVVSALLTLSGIALVLWSQNRNKQSRQ